MSRGFAGGLADGINQGMQMYALNESLKSRKKQDERADAADVRDQETHAAKQRELNDVRTMTEQWAAELGWNPQAAVGSPVDPNAPNMNAPAGLAPTPSAIGAPDAGLGGTSSNIPMNAPGALGREAPMQQQQEPISAGEYIQKQVWQGDAFSSPEKLNKLAAIAFANNQGQMGLQFLNQVHTATSKGWSKALASLVAGDGESAAKVLKENGMDVRGKMTPVEGKEHTWKANIGGKEQEISAKNLFMSANPEKAYEMHLTGKENQRKAELEEKKHALDVEKVANDTAKTKAEIGYLGERSALARAKAREAGRLPEEKGELKATKSTAKDLDSALTRRDKRFDLKATTRDEDGSDMIDPDMRAAYDDTAATLQSIIEEETGEELSHNQHQKLTDEVLRFPINGTPQEKNAAVRRSLKRLGLDVPEPETKKEPEALSGKAPEKSKAPPAAALKKEPTREEKELDSIKRKPDYPTLINDLKKLQKERYAVNLNKEEKTEVEKKIAQILKGK